MAHVDLDDRGIVVACTNCGKKNRLAFEKLGDAVRCGQCKQPLTALVNMPVELHSDRGFRSPGGAVVAAGRGRLLGAMVRPVPDGRAGAPESRGAAEPAG